MDDLDVGESGGRVGNDAPNTDEEQPKEIEAESSQNTEDVPDEDAILGGAQCPPEQGEHYDAPQDKAAVAVGGGGGGGATSHQDVVAAAATDANNINYNFCILEIVRERCDMERSKMLSDESPQNANAARNVVEDASEEHISGEESEGSEEFILELVRERCLEHGSFSSRKLSSRSMKDNNFDPSQTHIIPLPPARLTSNNDLQDEEAAPGQEKTQISWPWGIGAHRVSLGAETSYAEEGEPETMLSSTEQNYGASVSLPRLERQSGDCRSSLSLPGAFRASPGEALLSPNEENRAGETARHEPSLALDGRASSAATLQVSLDLLLETADLPEGFLLEATLVEEVHEGETLRRGSRLLRLTDTLVEAIPVNTIRCCPIDWKSRLLERTKLWFCLGVCLLAVALGLGLGLVLGRQDSGEDFSGTTLHRIRKRGVLRCQVGEFSNVLHYMDKFGRRQGFDVALCNAIAAAVLGPDAEVEITEVEIATRFLGLATHQADVIAGGITHTMERQVFEPISQTGYAFSYPYLYEGLHVAGEPLLVECLDDGLKITGDCAGLSVCTIELTSHYEVLSGLLPQSMLVVMETNEAMVQAFVDGKCKVIAHEGRQLQESSMRELGYRGDYMIGKSVLSKEPLAMVSRRDDPQWALFLNMVLQSLLVAEAHSITKETAFQFPQTFAFGEEYKDMFRNAIAVTGNYGELYDRFAEPAIPRKDTNQLNNIADMEKQKGLLFPHPFGSIEKEEEAYLSDLGYMEQVIRQGKIRCAIIPDRPGFSALADDGLTFEGIEVDLCRALSAALFGASSGAVELLPVRNAEQGYKALEAGQVDVFVGGFWNYEAQTHVSQLGTGFSFSPPYFYNNTATTSKEENLCLATTNRDHEWSSFVYWILNTLIDAEEKGIGSDSADALPDVNLFGPNHSSMLREAVKARGHYGQLYDRHLASLYPRTGRNQLNAGASPGPQHYAIPGLLQ